MAAVVAALALDGAAARADTTITTATWPGEGWKNHVLLAPRQRQSRTGKKSAMRGRRGEESRWQGGARGGSRGGGQRWQGDRQKAGQATEGGRCQGVQALQNGANDRDGGQGSGHLTPLAPAVLPPDPLQQWGDEFQTTH